MPLNKKCPEILFIEQKIYFRKKIYFLKCIFLYLELSILE